MTLTIQDLGALGELLGSVAVLATLVYLALQTRQNTMAIGAQLDAARLSATQSSFLATATSNELADLVREDSTGDVTTNQLRLGFFWASTFYSFQWQLQQVRRGLLPTLDEEVLAVNVRGFFSRSHSFQGWWGGVRWSFPSEVVEWVEEQRSKEA